MTIPKLKPDGLEYLAFLSVSCGRHHVVEEWKKAAG